MDIEKRAAKRITYLCEVECMGADMPCLRTRITDLSTAGVFVDSMICFAVGSTLRLRFHVNDIEIETMGEVRYCMPQIGMGVRFRNLRQEHRQLIESLVEGRTVSQGEAPCKAPSGPQQPAANVLSGNFAVVGLFDVIQMIDNSRLTGALRLTLPSTSGEIRFNEGQIVGASAGLLTDSDALNRLLGATEGSFEFQKSDLAFERTIKADSNTALLLELLRLKDEENIVPATPKSAG